MGPGFAGWRLPRQGKEGKTPCSAMQKFTPRYGCWFSCGKPPPWFGEIMFGAKVVLGDASLNGLAVLLPSVESALLLPGVPLFLARSDWANALTPWLCTGISVLMRVTVLTPKVSPSTRSLSPGLWPCSQPARAAKLGNWNVVVPLPP